MDLFTTIGILLVTASTASTQPQRFIRQKRPPVFSCSFLYSMCGMKNQEVARAQWTRQYVSLGGETGPAVVVNGNSANNHFARLLTPEIPTYDIEKGCLRFRYFISGRSAPSLSVIKQGYVTKYVFATAIRTRNIWKQAQVEVDLLGDVVLFYFEADTKVQEYGESIVAVKDVQFYLGPCTNRAV